LPDRLPPLTGSCADRDGERAGRNRKAAGQWSRANPELSVVRKVGGVSFASGFLGGVFAVQSALDQGRIVQ
jgi:hypothetical protein